MNRIKIKSIVLLALFIQLLWTPSLYAMERKHKVLVLHSYHQGLQWTDNITRGIKSIFDPFNDQYELHYEYLDTKRNSGAAYMQRLKELYLAKNEHLIFDAVIVSDNTGLEFVKQHRTTIFKDAPVIFCGVNRYRSELIKGFDNITGVAEYSDYRGTLSLMQQLHPQRDKVLVVLDRTPTGDQVYDDLISLQPEFEGKLELEFYRDFLLEEAVEKVSSLGDDSVVYMLTVNRDRNNNFISYQEGIQVISQSSSAPLYGSWDFYLGSGIVGGALTSGEQQGKQAANLALRVLTGESAGNIQPITYSPALLMFDFQAMKKFGISRHQLPEGSVVINAPNSFYEDHKVGIYIIAAVLLLIGLLIARYFYMQQRRLIHQQELTAELDRRVMEKTQSLELVNQELERLSQSDALTQMNNRGYFDEQLQIEWNRLGRLNRPLTMLMCDIDHFKKYNDTNGHLAGDECLRQVAGVIKKVFSRNYDFPARYGGEEFSVLLPDTSETMATQLAERLLKAIKSLDIEHSGIEEGAVLTMSIGIASLKPSRGMESTEIIRQADEALYYSKANGRARLTTYTQMMGEIA